MNWFNRLSIRARLTASFVLVAIIVGVIGAVGLTSVQRVHGLVGHMHDFELQGLYHVSRADTELMAPRSELRTAMLMTRGAQRDQAIQRMKERFRTLNAEVEKAGEFFLTEEGKGLHRQLAQNVGSYESGVANVLSLLANDYGSAQLQTVDAMMTAARPGVQAQEIVKTILERKLANAQAYEDQVDATSANTALMIGRLTIGGMLLALLLDFLQARNISRQLGGEPAHVAEIAATIAKGDLTANIDTEGLNPNSVMAHVAQMQASL